MARGKSWRKKGVESLQEFCDESSIHGFQYLAPSRGFVRRIVWILLLVLAFTLASLVVKSLLDNWESNPVAITIDTTEYSVTEIPFPAVTVCPNEYDSWGFLQRVLNMFDLTNDFLYDNWYVLPDKFLQELKTRIEMWAWEGLTFQEARYNLVDHCLSVVIRLKDTNLECLNVRMLYYIGLHDLDYANKLQTAIVDMWSYDWFVMEKFDRISYEQSEALQRSLYEVLKMKVIANNVSCFRCLDTDPDGSKLAFDNLSKALVQDVSTNDTDIANDGAIRNALEFREKIRIMRQDLRYLGTILASYVGSQAITGFNNIDIDKKKWQLNQMKNLADDILKGLSKNETSDQFDLYSIMASLSTIRENVAYIEGHNLGLQIDCNDIDENGSNGCYMAPLKTLLTIMKFNIGQPHMLDLDLLSVQRGGFINNLTMKYPDLINEIVDQVDLKLKPLQGKMLFDFDIVGNYAPFIPYCNLKNEWSNLPLWGAKFDRESDDYYFDEAEKVLLNDFEFLDEFCTLFRPTLTDKGLCYSFNSVDSQDLLVDSAYMDNYNKVFELPNAVTFNGRNNPYIGKGLGIQNGIRLVLDAHTLDNLYKVPRKLDTTFQISIQHPKDFPLSIIDGIEVKGGQRTSIIIDPQLIRPSENIQALDLEQRNCGYPEDSHELKLFRNYTHKACLFECMYNGALEHCGCVPWNYPHHDKELNGSRVCNGLGNVCFANQMKNMSLLQPCQCHSDCVKTLYPFNVNQQKLEPEDCIGKEELFYTQGQRDLEESTMMKVTDYLKNFQIYPSLQQYWNDLKRYSNNSRIPRFSCPDRLLNDIAIVDIYYSTQFATKLHRDVTATFTDKVASIGGTLGLFCGISILSFVEVILCLFKVWCKNSNLVKK